MKLAIMQPYFFPYLGYISLLKHTDRFILFDTVQFIRHGWIDRNRILKPNEGWQYIKVPLQKFHQKTIIKDIFINNKVDWKSKILAQLQHYKKVACYYNQTIDLLNDVFSYEISDIVLLNKTILDKICIYLQIKNDIQIFSQMDIAIDEVNTPDEWALNICKAIKNVNEYWNPPGGQVFFDRKKYAEANIELKFHSIKFMEYNQKGNTFEPGLSIIDVMMFNNIEKINKMLDEYEFI